MKSAAAIVCVLAAVCCSAVRSAEDNTAVAHAPQQSQVTQRFIVKWRNANQSVQSSSTTGRKEIQSARMTLRSVRALSDRMEVVRVEGAAAGDTADSVLARLQSTPDIEYAVPDRRRYRHALPDDPLYSGQWYLQTAQPAAIAASNAWDVTTGSTGTVIAFIDTGVRFDHPDLQRAEQGGRLLPGYDFVSADPKASASQPDTFLGANDGNGWDADPSDPGDWVNSTDKQNNVFSDCAIEDSSWHGTRVAGIIGARTNNGAGVAGITWSSWLLPVRVLGKCGGYDSDIVAGMRWAAGISVSGAPVNPYPANIINLSLGGNGPCSALYQSVISEITARGVAVVVSAGNENGHAVDEPANCPGAIAVAGLRQAGTKVGYSNIGPEVSIGAPAGNCVNSTGACLFSIDTTYDVGTTTATQFSYTDQTHTNLGTSFSAPMVAGALGLMHAVNAKLTPAQFLARLKQSATPFPVSSDPTIPNCRAPTATSADQLECNCTTSTCGAGMVNAAAAVTTALRPIAGIVPSSPVAAGQNVTLAGSASASCSRTISTYAWTVVSSGPAPVISGMDQATATVQAPASGSFTLRLTVTDDQGAQDFADVVVTPTSATSTATAAPTGSACPVAILPPAPPTSASNKGGGGGLFGAWTLLAIAALRRRRTQASQNN